MKDIACIEDELEGDGNNRSKPNEKREETSMKHWWVLCQVCTCLPISFQYAFAPSWLHCGGIAMTMERRTPITMLSVLLTASEIKIGKSEIKLLKLLFTLIVTVRGNAHEQEHKQIGLHILVYFSNSWTDMWLISK